VLAVSGDSPGYAMVELGTDGVRLLSRITSKSAHTLGLHPNQTLYAQIKGVAIVP